MPHYKDPEGRVHFLDDSAFSHLLPTGSIEISDEEAAAIQSPSSALIKAEKWEAIKAKRDRLTFEGGVLVDGKWFKTNESARADYLSIEALARVRQSSPGDVIRPAWRTMDRDSSGHPITVDMTASLATRIIAAGAQQWFAIDSAAEAHRAALWACADPDSYDFSGGWPPTFPG